MSYLLETSHVTSQVKLRKGVNKKLKYHIFSLEVGNFELKQVSDVF